MQIIYDIKDELFGNLSKDELKTKLWEHWSQLDVKPTSIEFIDDGFVCVNFDDDAVEKAMLPEAEYAASLCNQGKFDKAEKILLKVTKKAPANSDAWRLLAQIHFQNNETDTAVDELISSLAANPKNKWALILMGNIYANKKDDIQTAEKYFLTVLKYYPDDMIAYNNLGGMYMRQEHFNDAIPIFEKVLDKDPGYLNAYYGLACCYQQLGKLHKAWKICQEGLKAGVSMKENPGVRDELLKVYIEIAKKIEEQTNGRSIWQGIADELHDVDGKDIVFEEDNGSMVLAHLSNTYSTGKGKHRVKYDPSKPHITHLIIHELTHLRMSQLAMKAGKEKFLMSTPEENINFNKRFGAFFKKTIKDLPDARREQFVRKIHEGISLQLMNCPLDLFVEEYIYKNYPKLRPLQMLSIFSMEQTNIEAANNKDFAKMYPQSLITANKVMNLVTSLHLKKLFGLDFVNYHRPTKAELTQANDLYDEFLAYDDYKPGEEYELCEYFIETFDMSDLVRIEDAASYIKQKELVTSLPETEAEKDAQYNQATQANADFAQNHPDGEDHAQTMMMQFYMLGAMQYLGKIDEIHQKMIAQEIMMTGVNGISPQGTYSIPAIPNKEFCGWEFLAYYYVSVSWAFPELIDKLGLPFKTAYNGAMFMYNMNKKK